jgi:hypothetical protein
MTKTKKIPTILAILILTLGIAVGVFFISQPQLFNLQASPSQIPKGVRVTNITDKSFTISYKTDEPSQGFVTWGKDKNYGQILHDKEKSLSSLHHITLTDLSPSQTYFFAINSDGNTYDNNGIPWQVTTSPTLPSNDQFLVTGKIVNEQDQPISSAIVYLTAPDLSPLSTSTSQNGEWVISLSKARTLDLSSTFKLNSQTFEIFVEAGPNGLSTAQVSVDNLNPIPKMTLGRIYDFKNPTAVNVTNQPKASVQLPQNQDVKSYFTSLSEQSEEKVLAATDQQTVDLKSFENNEIIYTNSPEFFGKGPAGENIKITVKSDPQTENLKVDSTGNWSWSPPQKLQDGIHTLTISWYDASGILRTLTRSFTVFAADEPAFESTPSGSTNNQIAQAQTPSPSPTPTPSPSPTASPKTTATPSPSPTSSPTSSPSASPKVTASPKPSTSSDLPQAGDPLPTIIFVVFGAALLLSGSFITLLSYLQEENQ